MSKNITFTEHLLINCTFQVQKFKADGTITYDGPVFNNLILNSGLDFFGGGTYSVTAIGGKYSAGGYVNVGEGSSSPTVTQTGLDSFVAATDTVISTSKGYSASSPIHFWNQGVFEFAIGSCTGNLTEVGLSNSSNADYFNRQLFKDEAGDPTTITVLSDEGLRITCRLYVYSDLEPGSTTSGSFLLNSTTTYNYTREVTSDTSWLEAGQLTLSVAGAKVTDDLTTFTAGTGGGRNQKTYTTGDYYYEWEFVWSAGTFVGTVNSVLFYLGSGQYYNSTANHYPYTAFRLGTGISLDDTQQLTLVLRRSWGRYVA